MYHLIQLMITQSTSVRSAFHFHCNDASAELTAIRTPCSFLASCRLQIKTQTQMDHLVTHSVGVEVLVVSSRLPVAHLSSPLHLHQLLWYKCWYSVPIPLVPVPVEPIPLTASCTPYLFLPPPPHHKFHASTASATISCSFSNAIRCSTQMPVVQKLFLK